MTLCPLLLHASNQNPRSDGMHAYAVKKLWVMAARARPRDFSAKNPKFFPSPSGNAPPRYDEREAAGGLEKLTGCKSLRRLALHLPGASQMAHLVRWGPVAVLGGLLAALYGDVVPSMIARWWEDEGYSHGFLVLPLAAFLVWRQRGSLAAIRPERDGRGLLLLAFASLLYVTGKLGAEFFLMRISLVVVLAALVWTFWGFSRLKRIAFPLLLLASTVPLPVLIYNRLAGPLQLLASAASTEVALAMGISVYRDGNIIQLANTSLGVAEACSGLRSASSLAVGALLLAYLELKRPGPRVALFLLALPVAVMFNVLRVAGTAVLSERDPLLGTGFYHGFSGWLIFMCGFGLLWLSARLLRKLFEPSRVSGEEKR